MDANNKYYLCDFGHELVLLAKQIESECQKHNDEFQKGRAFAMYEVLDLMKLQAKAFGLTDTQIGIEGMDIESLLK